MMVKVEMGEWVNVYQYFVGWVEIPDDKDITPETIEQAIEAKGIDFEKNEYDWTTEDHDKWDFDGMRVLETRKNTKEQ